MEIKDRVEEWTKGTILTDDENMSLPVPRLEIRYFNYEIEGFNLVAIYSLIYKHLLGDIISVPFSYTKAQHPKGTPINNDGTLSIPFRDESHIENEKKQLNLPAYVVYSKKYQVI